MLHFKSTCNFYNYNYTGLKLKVNSQQGKLYYKEMYGWGGQQAT